MNNIASQRCHNHINLDIGIAPHQHLSTHNFRHNGFTKLFRSLRLVIAMAILPALLLLPGVGWCESQPDALRLKAESRFRAATANLGGHSTVVLSAHKEDSRSGSETIYEGRTGQYTIRFKVSDASWKIAGPAPPGKSEPKIHLIHRFKEYLPTEAVMENERAWYEQHCQRVRLGSGSYYLRAQANYETTRYKPDNVGGGIASGAVFNFGFYKIDPTSVSVEWVFGN